jgi:hypothetical protein
MPDLAVLDSLEIQGLGFRVEGLGQMPDLAVLDSLEAHLLAVSAVDHVEIHVKLGGHGLVHNLDYAFLGFGVSRAKLGGRSSSLVHNLDFGICFLPS